MFIRLHLNYADIIYDKPNNELFCKIIKIVQYNVRLAITGAIQGISQEKLDQDFGLESLSDTRWYRKLFFIKSNIISLQHILILICIIIIQIHLIALDHHKMKLLEHFHLELKVSRICFSQIVSRSGLG